MLQLSEHAIAMASVETVAVERRPLSRELRAVGRIEYNESSLATITPRVDGYAERLFVNFTGVVAEINPDKSTLKIMVSILGRQAPVELDFSQVESM